MSLNLNFACWKHSPLRIKLSCINQIVSIAIVWWRPLAPRHSLRQHGELTVTFCRTPDFLRLGESPALPGYTGLLGLFWYQVCLCGWFLESRLWQNRERPPGMSSWEEEAGKSYRQVGNWHHRKGGAVFPNFHPQAMTSAWEMRSHRR